MGTKLKGLISFLIAVLIIGQPLGAATLDTNEKVANLIADDIEIDGDLLTAAGNVIMRYEGRLLRANSVIYNQSADTLKITGPIRLIEPDGTTVIADEATLGSGLRNGVMRSARMVLDNQMQFAAQQIERKDPRFVQMAYTSATSCQICPGSTTPIWEIRAKRVIHDTEEKQLYFDQAQVRFFDVPLIYIPRLRLPDPTVTRMRGVLVPSLVSRSGFGLGMKLPYFIPIGDHRDLTISPWIAPETRTVELRYRQAFYRGKLTIHGAVSNDTLREYDNRAYLFAKGHIDLDGEFKLKYDFEWATDEAYLSDYGFANKSRLDSAVSIERYRRNEAIYGAITRYTSLRNSEADEKIPSLVSDFEWTKRYQNWPVQGDTRFNGEIHSHFRTSDLDRVGRDIARISGEVDWHNRTMLGYGALVDWRAAGAIDMVQIAQDARYNRALIRRSFGASAELRWPFHAITETGRRLLLEPIWQLAINDTNNQDIPAEESSQAELDEGNLFALSRFPARDRREDGVASVLGLRFRSDHATGLSYGMTIGQVTWSFKNQGFSLASGLQGKRSDILLSGWANHPAGYSFAGRSLLDQSGKINKAEAKFSINHAPVRFDLEYLLLQADPLEEREQPITEWSISGSYKFARHWTVSQTWRYDLVSDRSSNGTFGLNYENECILIGFQAARSFGQSENFRPKTDYRLTVSLKGFSTGGKADPTRRRCGVGT